MFPLAAIKRHLAAHEHIRYDADTLSTRKSISIEGTTNGFKRTHKSACFVYDPRRTSGAIV